MCPAGQTLIDGEAQWTQSLPTQLTIGYNKVGGVSEGGKRGSQSSIFSYRTISIHSQLAAYCVHCPMFTPTAVPVWRNYEKIMGTGPGFSTIRISPPWWSLPSKCSNSILENFVGLVKFVVVGSFLNFISINRYQYHLSSISVSNFRFT